MPKRLRVLNVEDSEPDSALLARHLSAAGYEVFLERVDSAAGMTTALIEKDWDVVLCDYRLPRFDALAALDVLRASGLDFPFIIISGTVGEDIAVKAMLTGANDYLSKDNLTRLVPAIERELNEARNRKAQRLAEEARLVSEERYRALFEYAADGIVVANPDSYYLDANAAMCTMIGYSRDELIGMHASDIVTQAEIKHLSEALDEIKGGTHYKREWQFRRKDGSVFAGDVTVNTMPDGNLLAMIRDVTDLKSAAEKIGQSENQLAEAQQLAQIGSWNLDLVTHELTWSVEHFRIFGMLPKEIELDHETTLPKFIHPDDLVSVRNAVANSIETGSPFSIRYRIIRPDTSVRFIESCGNVSADEHGVPTRLYGTIQDITERDRAENERKIISDIIHDTILAPNLESFLELVHRSISEIVYAENCFVMLHEPTSNIHHFEFWVDKYDPRPAPRTAGRGFSSYVLRTGKPLLITEELEQTILAAGEAEQIGSFSPSWLGVPLRASERTIGVLVVQHYEKENIYNERDLDFLSSVGDQVAVAIERKVAERALSESEVRYRSVVETAPDVIITIDDAGTMCFVNPAAQRVFGYELSEMKGQALTMLMPEYLRHLHEAGFERYKTTGIKHVAWEYVELTGRHKSGNDVPITLSFSEFAQNGRRYFTGIIRDITERREAMEALRSSEERYRDVVENALDIIYTYDLQGNFTSVNKAATTMTGYSNHEALAMNVADVLGAASNAKAGEMIQDRLAGNDTPAYELELIAKDGHSIPVEVKTRIIYGENGPIGVQGIARDITERKRAASALEAAEAKYRTIFENAIEGIFQATTDGRFIFVNPALADILGYDSPEQLIAERAEADKQYYVESDCRTKLGKMLAKDGVVAGFECQVFRRDGSKIWIRENIRAVYDERGNILHYDGSIADITDRKRTSIELDALTVRTERRERMLTTMLSSMTDFAQIYDRDGRILFVNQPLLDLWGLTIDEVVGKDFYDLGYPAELAERLHTQLRQVFTNHESITDETPFTGVDGAPGFYEYILSPAIGPEGNVDFVVGSTRDVTDRYYAAEKLRSSEENLAKSQEIAHLGSWDLQIPETGRIDDGPLHWSDEVFRIFGYEPKQIEISNDVFFNAVHPDDRADVAAAVAKSLADGSDYRIDHRILRPDGTERFVHEHAELIRDKQSGKPIRMVGTIQDITNQKQLGEQLRQAQKMEAVGVLAGGIAHDFNNLLTAINGYSDLTLRKMSPDDPLRLNIEEVRNAGNRAAELTSQLLAFSRKQVLKPAVINLNSVVTNIEKILRRVISESIELQVKLDPSVGNVKADPGQIEQVIMNLAVNSRDAMPNGGTLTVETQNVYLDDSYVYQHLSVRPGDFVKITMTDRGEGMDAETKAHIFEPFFTTKEVGKGTGLGLSMVYGIVKQSGGDIMVYSELGHGTTIKIYLPCVDEQAPEPRRARDRPQKHAGSETVLVVEDEEVVRRLVSEILTGNGYKVLEAESGKAALSICQSHTDTIDMLLTDVVMPKMGGSELSDRVVKLRPGIKVLFMSGYTDDSVANRGVFESNTEFIEKPFSPTTLARKVREVLEIK